MFSFDTGRETAIVGVAALAVAALGGCAAAVDSKSAAVPSTPNETSAPAMPSPTIDPTLKSGSTCAETSWNPWYFRTCTYVDGSGTWVNYVNVNVDRPEPFPRGDSCHAKAHVWQTGRVNLNGSNHHCDWWRAGNTEQLTLNTDVSEGLLCGALVFFDGNVSNAACINIEADGSMVPVPGGIASSQ